MYLNYSYKVCQSLQIIISKYGTVWVPVISQGVDDKLQQPQGCLLPRAVWKVQDALAKEWAGPTPRNALEWILLRGLPTLDPILWFFIILKEKKHQCSKGKQSPFVDRSHKRTVCKSSPLLRADFCYSFKYENFCQGRRNLTAWKEMHIWMWWYSPSILAFGR